MNNKNWWFDKLEVCLKEEKNPEADISWTSSDSDNDSKNVKLHTKKRRINSDTKWIKPVTSENRRSPSMSPIINHSIVDRKSSVISSSQNSEKSIESSPIIQRIDILNKIKCKLKNKFKLNEEVSVNNASPDLFESQCSAIENDSPECTDVEISPVKSLEEVVSINSPESPVKEKFEICYSQSCTPICNNIDNESSSSLYYQPRKKRKRSKRKGLSSQLEKVLRKQQSQVSIWKYEMTRKSSSELEGILFTIVCTKSEYGCLILECKDIEICSDDFGKVIEAIILISQSGSKNFIENKRYKLFLPYETKLVRYQKREILCYFNIKKIISLKDLK